MEGPAAEARANAFPEEGAGAEEPQPDLAQVRSGQARQQDGRTTGSRNELTNAADVRKPRFGAFGMFRQENGATLSQQASRFGEESKLVSAAWKALSDEQRAEYERKYDDAFAKYKALARGPEELRPDFAQVRPKRARQQDGGATASHDAPTHAAAGVAGEAVAVCKPRFGAFGMFRRENGATFRQQASSFGEESKLISAAWKALGEEQRAEYKRKYDDAFADYKSSWVKSLPELD